MRLYAVLPLVRESVQLQRCEAPVRCDDVVRSVVLSLLVLFPVCSISMCWGLTFTCAHVLVRPLVDGAASRPTDKIGKRTSCSSCSPATLAVLSPHVCHRQETGLSRLARTCSRTWKLLKHPDVQAHRPFTSATSIENVAIVSPKTRLFSVRELKCIWEVEQMTSG